MRRIEMFSNLFWWMMWQRKSLSWRYFGSLEWCLGFLQAHSCSMLVWHHLKRFLDTNEVVHLRGPESEEKVFELSKEIFSNSEFNLSSNSLTIPELMLCTKIWSLYKGSESVGCHVDSTEWFACVWPFRTVFCCWQPPTHQTKLSESIQILWDT